MPSRRVDRDQYLDNWAGLGDSQISADPRPYHARQRLIRRMTRSVVKPNHGIKTTSILTLRTAGISLSTFGSRSKNRWRLRKMYAPPAKLIRKKNVAAIRRAGRAAGLISASI